ncbi:hypothetical protein LVB77_11835 [Lysobacter sp. 5GHs7-4]|uniref:hypothetical protein n=1 Tax=Lysobacter sp. 5GHs7-4 TaxID=2904253 RepID=UPI001E5206AB|nr:hypothetical protein [Lysobacter sp. 5GHs7-4]UHQ21380.1 hypothetical protein LVB77_11835 [Lysobacter sp. 5GHs7-4]
MVRASLIPVATALLLLSLGAVAASPATATQPAAAKSAPAKTAAGHCRDSKGQFVSCEKKAEAKHCRNAQGKFTACPK